MAKKNGSKYARKQEEKRKMSRKNETPKEEKKKTEDENQLEKLKRGMNKRHNNFVKEIKIAAEEANDKQYKKDRRRAQKLLNKAIESGDLREMAKLRKKLDSIAFYKAMREQEKSKTPDNMTDYEKFIKESQQHDIETKVKEFFENGESR